MLPWYSLGLVLIGAGILVSVVCRATLHLGLLPLWTVFVLAAMLSLVKGYSEFLGPIEQQSIG
jgi:hypothetical protein